MKTSISFDDAVDFYDRTRGGLPVGRTFAEVMSTHLKPGSRVLELGVGTGLVALPLTELGHTVLGIDLSPKMIEHARDRIGARLAVADASAGTGRVGHVRRRSSPLASCT